MSRAIEILENEHRLIERVLDAFQDWAERLDGAESDDPRGVLVRFVAFVRGFADRCHHGKEEEILFREMTERGFPTQQGPLAVMYLEHDQGRALVRRLDELGRQEAAWSPEDREAVQEATEDFAAMLRHHIVKEDSILYPMAERFLGPEVMGELEERFDRFDQEQVGEELPRLRELAEELIRAQGSGEARSRPVLPCHQDVSAA